MGRVKQFWKLNTMDLHFPLPLVTNHLRIFFWEFESIGPLGICWHGYVKYCAKGVCILFILVGWLVCYNLPILNKCSSTEEFAVQRAAPWAHVMHILKLNRIRCLCCAVVCSCTLYNLSVHILWVNVMYGVHIRRRENETESHKFFDTQWIS